MYILYSFLLFLSLLYYLPATIWKLKIRRGEKLNLKERFGLSLSLPSPEGISIWFHAVSVGEVLSLQALVRTLKIRHPDWTIYCSALTNSGYAMAVSKLEAADYIFYVPFDFAWIVRKYFKRIQPRLFILAESEFWPNLLRTARRYAGGVLLVNGRISDRSGRRFRRFRCLVHPLLDNIDRFLVQTGADSSRLQAVGLSENRICVVGNLKADIELPPMSVENAAALRADLNCPPEAVVLLAGSVHGGEDEQVLKAYSKARVKRPELRLIIAPRHLDRVEVIDSVCRERGFTVARRTGEKTDQKWDVFILDTLGELARFYAVCDIAFLGGSLIPWGGQNFLEPAFYGKP
ncbi:MAG: hypothetical protein MUP70_02385, partial [Candidatus Aminicenantes bacterium]|nr:hypothetical protein [Candidatus Aminicenantes bacterium]